MASSALAPSASAVFALLQDATLLATLTGGFHNDLPQGRTFPCGWYEVSEVSARGMGTGELPKIELRTHIFARRGGDLATVAEAQEANRLTRSVLEDQALTVSGYSMCGHVFWRETLPPLEEELNGVPVWEIVSVFEWWVER